MTSRVAIVISHFGQPGYLLESVASAWATGSLVVVVDDGSNDSVRSHVQGICSSYDERLVLLQLPENRGLSGARNAAIDWVRAYHPEVEFFLPLDADDLLEADATVRLLDAWAAAPSGTGWVYGHATLFGTYEVTSWVPRRFTVSRLLVGNYCFSTSLVHRNVFEAGARYSEELRDGLEDWDFYLQAVEHGFRGSFAGDFGFHYRKHGSSMLATTNQRLATVEESVRRRHPALFTTEYLAAAEHTEMPRFAVLDIDTAELSLLSSPDREHRLIDLRQAQPGYLDDFRPPILIAARHDWLQQVRRERTWHQVLSTVQVALGHQSYLCLGWHPTDRDDRFGLVCTTSDEPLGGIAVSLVHATAEPEHLLRLAEGLAETGTRFTFGPLRQTPHRPEAVSNRAVLCAAFGELTAPRAQTELQYPGDPIYPTDQEFSHQQVASRLKRLELRVRSTGVRNIGIVLPWVGLGGMDLIMLELGKALSVRSDVRVHLLTSESGAIEMSSRYAEVFDSISPVASTSHNDRTVQAFAEEMDVLLVANSPKLFGMLQAVRQRTSPAVYAFIQNVDISTADGVSVGYLFPLARQFDAHIDGYFLPSTLSARLVESFGVDPAKVHVVPNAAVYSPREPATVEARITASTDLPDRPVRLLYAGRFDEQKGIDRLRSIFVELEAKEVPFEARLVGKAVVGDDTLSPRHNLTVMPPSYENETMASHFEWADALLLPSRWEGFPLVMLDAMRFGALVISTDVGGIPEWVTDGEQCVLVPNSGSDVEIVESFVATCARLRTNPDDFVAIRRNARDFSNSLNWTDIAAAVVATFPEGTLQ